MNLTNFALSFINFISILGLQDAKAEDAKPEDVGQFKFITRSILCWSLNLRIYIDAWIHLYSFIFF